MMMNTRTAYLGLGLALAVGASTPVAASDAYHFALSESSPEADASGPAPEEVRLWFTQVPQENSVAIRLIDAAGDALETGEPTADEEDGTIVSVSIDGHLGVGTYTVAWRGIGDDGHVVRGDFEFAVTAQ